MRELKLKQADKADLLKERHAGNRRRSLTVCVNETHSCQSWLRGGGANVTADWMKRQKG